MQNAHFAIATERVFDAQNHVLWWTMVSFQSFDYFFFILSLKIVHLAAYTPKEQFDQYVIPVMNLNPAARQRHQLRIITVGFFRMLKCTLTNKVVKCKTEVVALKAFLNWLEERRAAETESNGIVLVYNESIKFVPYMLLEALKKYDLVERFSRLVVGFVDGHALAEKKLDTDEKVEKLREKADALDNEEEDSEKNFEGNAMVRARGAYQLVEQLAKSKLLRLCGLHFFFSLYLSFPSCTSNRNNKMNEHFD